MADGLRVSVVEVSSAARVLCDWGSSRLRAFLEIGGEIAARGDGPGINLLGAESPARALAGMLAAWPDAHRPRVFLCGMAGSRNGLAEVPYVRAPATAQMWQEGALPVRVEGFEACIAPGILAQNFHEVADVMRGEETQIFGALSLEQQLATDTRLMVLPGTHSKWVEVCNGAITRVQTYFTGELFDLLSRHSSLLRVATDPGMDEEGFEAGVRAAARADLAASLFETRTAQLIEGRTAGWARAFLSGLLIGAELDSMLGMRALGAERLTLIGEPRLTARYRCALALNHIDAEALDGERCVLAGLRALADAQEEG